MLRISKLADYACILMAYLGRQNIPLSAVEISTATHLQLPTVRKLLKALNKAGLLKASRGVQGGYQLVKPLKGIMLLAIIEAVDGPIAVTSCAQVKHSCDISQHCPNQANWLSINRVVRDALAHMPVGY